MAGRIWSMIIRTAIKRDVSVIADFNIRLALETEALNLDPEIVRGRRRFIAGSKQGNLFRGGSGCIGRSEVSWSIDDYVRMERLAERKHLVDSKCLRAGGIPGLRGFPGAVRACGETGAGNGGRVRAAVVHGQ